MARFASRASSDYHIYLFFKGMKEEEKKCPGIITSVGRDSFNIMLPKYGLECPVKFTPQDIESNSKAEQYVRVSPFSTSSSRAGSTRSSIT